MVGTLVHHCMPRTMPRIGQAFNKSGLSTESMLQNQAKIPDKIIPKTS